MSTTATANDKPTHKGLWWFEGTWKGEPFSEAISFDGEDTYSISLVGCLSGFQLKDFVGEFLPLDWDVVKRGQAKE